MQILQEVFYLKAFSKFILRKIQCLFHGRLLTGFFLGLLIGGVQRSAQEAKAYRLMATQENAEAYAKEFIQEHNLPHYSHLNWDPSNGKITILCGREHLQTWQNNFPKLFVKVNPFYFESPTKLSLTLGNPIGNFSSASLRVDYHGYDYFEGYNFHSCCGNQELSLLFAPKNTSLTIEPSQVALVLATTSGALSPIISEI